MNIRLLTVGRADTSLHAFEEGFYKRLKSFAGFDIVELPEGRGKQLTQRKQEEEKIILKTVHSHFILFDERGKIHTSRQWANYLEMQTGNASLDFVIGGAAGVTDAVRTASSGCWSLSALTLPHKLARVVVVEQLYRAFTIMNHHPYHRD